MNETFEDIFQFVVNIFKVIKSDSQDQCFEILNF